jgi:hypothetical protein
VSWPGLTICQARPIDETEKAATGSTTLILNRKRIHTHARAKAREAY